MNRSVVNVNNILVRKKVLQFVAFLKAVYVELQLCSQSCQRQSRSRIALRLWLHRNEAAPYSSGSDSGSAKLNKSCISPIWDYAYVFIEIA
jgi:hypothetical protein